MRSDFDTAILQIAGERGIPREAVLNSVQHALGAAYRKMTNTREEVDVDVEMNFASGSFRVFHKLNVVETVEDPDTEISLAEALAHSTSAQIGDVIRIERTPENFGRIAAQNVKQMVLQQIRDYERQSIYDQFRDREGEVINGIVQRADSRTVIVELGPAEAVMPVREQVPNERYRPGQRVKVLLKEVSRDQRGPQLVVSRATPDLIKRLFEMEVPEISSGAVEIMAIAREPGVRSKVAVAARQEKVDPVGSCVGMRGVRIQNIVNELYGEKIDVIEWSADSATFIANALSPAKPTSVQLSEGDGENRIATVIVPSDQMSLAIGKEGQNARLAAKLTSWRIDIKDPESLRGQDIDLFRRASESIAEAASEELMWQGRQPGLVRGGMISVRGKSIGPLDADLDGRQIDYEVNDGVVEVYYIRELRHRFDYATGEALSLDDYES
ncbi:MAG: transcription termination/antitermination protein NusA [Thermomicrobiales bacterium]|nr:transcription termination/antitermination protein NusA [Thermomicrobiales bacterium]